MRSTSDISFINPVDVSRRVFVWSCGTYSSKALRNNVYRSHPQLARSLRHKNIHFGWKDVERIYLRDEERMNNNISRQTELNKHYIYLDK